jgi:hypothetical protein
MPRERATGGRGPERASKPCAVCGRPIQWRKKWERDWEHVRHCSEGCRRRARSVQAQQEDAALERSILELLSGRDGSICPSEAARAIGGERWRDLLEPARSAARRLALRGIVKITQGDRAVDPGTFRGAVRVRRAK